MLLIPFCLPVLNFYQILLDIAFKLVAAFCEGHFDVIFYVLLNVSFLVFGILYAP
jgi:hypothetical protein